MEERVSKRGGERGHIDWGSVCPCGRHECLDCASQRASQQAVKVSKSVWGGTEAGHVPLEGKGQQLAGAAASVQPASGHPHTHPASCTNTTTHSVTPAALSCINCLLHSSCTMPCTSKHLRICLSCACSAVQAAVAVLCDGRTWHV